MALMIVVSCAYAQRHHDSDKKNAAKNEQVSKVKPHGAERRTGAARRYTYKIDKMAVNPTVAMDAKLTITASTANHKLTIKSDHNNGRISWKLFDGEGTQLDENWWSGNETSMGFGRYDEGDYYIHFTDALGKEARYKVSKKLNK